MKNGADMNFGHERAAIAACSLSRRERGGVRGYKLSISPNPLTPTLSPAGRGSPAVPQSESVLTNERGDATVDCRTGWIGSATGWSNGKLLAAAAHTGAGVWRCGRRWAW